MTIMKIEFPDYVEPQKALELVREVVLKGKISENKHGATYCAVTTFGNDYEVYASRSVTLDTFRVYRAKLIPERKL